MNAQTMLAAAFMVAIVAASPASVYSQPPSTPSPNGTLDVNSAIDALRNQLAGIHYTLGDAVVVRIPINQATNDKNFSWCGEQHGSYWENRIDTSTITATLKLVTQVKDSIDASASGGIIVTGTVDYTHSKTGTQTVTIPFQTTFKDSDVYFSAQEKSTQQALNDASIAINNYTKDIGDADSSRVKQIAQDLNHAMDELRDSHLDLVRLVDLTVIGLLGVNHAGFVCLLPQSISTEVAVNFDTQKQLGVKGGIPILEIANASSTVSGDNQRTNDVTIQFGGGSGSQPAANPSNTPVTTPCPKSRGKGNTTEEQNPCKQ